MALYDLFATNNSKEQLIAVKSFFEKLYRGSQQDFYGLTAGNLEANRKMFVVTANPEIFMQADGQSDLRAILSDSDTTLVADGIGIVKGARMLGIPMAERIPGVELSEFLLAKGSELGSKVFLFGAQKSVLDALCAVIAEKYSGLSLVGACDGYVADKDAVFDQMVAAEPDIVLVALGVPQQEELIYRHLHKFSKGIFVGVGGSFDVLSNKKSRAPKLFIRLNLEWLYRILREPSRLKRFYQNNVKFIFRVRKLK